MAIEPYKTTYLLIPIHKKKLCEKEAISCKSLSEAEGVAIVFGMKKFTIVKQTEMDSMVRSRIFNSQNEKSETLK